jgi:integrase
MDLVEKVRHDRKRGRALSKDEINRLLQATDNQTEHDIIMIYINTGCRVAELDSILVKHIDFDKNEIFIDGTKTKGSKRAMPIMPPIKPILERLTANRNGEEKLFPTHTINTIRNFHKPIKAKTKIKFTLKDYRHTFATNCKDNGIPSSVYFRWFGWSDDTMARKVYTHQTGYEMQVSQEWASKFA